MDRKLTGSSRHINWAHYTQNLHLKGEKAQDDCSQTWSNMSRDKIQKHKYGSDNELMYPFDIFTNKLSPLWSINNI